MHDVLDPDDGHSRRMDLPDGFDEFEAFALGQSAGNFIEQQQMRIGRKRARHLEPLAFEQRQCAGEGVGPAIRCRRSRISAQGPAASRSVNRPPCTAATSRFSKTVRSSNGRGI